MKLHLFLAINLVMLLSRLEAAPVLSMPHVLVSSSSGGVSRVNAATGQYIDKLFTGFNLTSGAPMAVGPDGHLYVGSFNGNVVHEFDIHTGVHYGVFATAAQGVRGIAFGPNGNLFVAAANANAIKEYDRTTGQFIRNFLSVNTPIDLTFGPSNVLYVARGHHQISNPSSILRFDAVTGNPLGAFATQQVDTPQALLLGREGDIFVTNQWDNAAPVVKFDVATGAVEFATSDLGNPQGLLLLPNRTLLVATASSFIHRYHADTGAFLGTFISDSRLGSTSDLIYVPEPSTAVLTVIASVMSVVALAAHRKIGCKH